MDDFGGILRVKLLWGDGQLHKFIVNRNLDPRQLPQTWSIAGGDSGEIVEITVRERRRFYDIYIKIYRQSYIK